MSKFDNLYSLLNEQLQLYTEFYEIEKEKYNVIIEDKISRLDEIVSEEQVFFLKTRGLEIKREKILKELNMTGKTLKEVIDSIDAPDKDRFMSLHADLYKILVDFKSKNVQCQDLAQIRIHRAQQMLSRLDEKNEQNKKYYKDGTTGEISIDKTNLISKKI